MKSKVIAPDSKFSITVTDADNNLRLDVFLSKQFESYSRSFFQKLISEDGIVINNILIKKSSHQVKTDDEILVTFPSLKEVNLKKIESDFGIEVLFEHPDFLIIYKPAGILVHEASSKKDVISLVDWLLHKFKEIAQVGSPERPGIVHRLDMKTSGIMIIPRNNFALAKFGQMFKDRQIKKTYLAIVQGFPEQSGVIDYSIMRHASGHKMTHAKFYNSNAREANTNYKVLKYLKDSALMEVNPTTGRTHQIRVHFAAIGHPIIGDMLYGKKSKLIERQALHAYSLEFEYEGEKFKFEKNMPEDMMNLLEKN